MSATSTNSQQKSKTDFKRLASDLKSSGIKRIESPLAKYNSIGQLTCVICSQVVKSELIWNAHLNSKLHIENKNKLKLKLIADQKQPTSSQTTSTAASKSNKSESGASAGTDSKEKTLKRPITSGDETESINKSTKKNVEDVEIAFKKAKLDNLIKKSDKAVPVPLTESKSVKINEENQILTIKSETELQQQQQPIETDKQEESTSAETTTTTVVASGLPEGFFDDPELDAKVRGVSRAENLEAEYEEFKKIIQTEEYRSELLMEKDDAIREVERDLEEVDELINRWSKIEDLHLKREAILKSSKEKLKKDSNQESQMELENNDSDSDDSDVDLENVLNFNLRTKNRY